MAVIYHHYEAIYHPNDTPNCHLKEPIDFQLNIVTKSLGT